MNEFRKAQEGRYIGALLRVPFLTFVDHIYQGVHAAGFEDITYAHLTLFRHIDQKLGSRTVDMAEDAQITKQSMSYLVDDLEARGYVERVDDPADGRARLVRLTAKGAAVMTAAAETAQRVEDEWAGYIGQERLNALCDTLKDLVAVLEEQKFLERARR